MHIYADKETKSDTRAAAENLAARNTESSVSFVDNRAEAIAQRKILELIDDSQKTRGDMRPDVTFPSGSQSPIQRLVATIPDASGQDNRIFFNTTLTAHEYAGGQIKLFDNCDFSGPPHGDFATDNEKLAITGHGRPGYISGLPAANVAARLTQAPTGLTKASHDIFFENCNAATPDNGNASVIETVRTSIRDHLSNTDTFGGMPNISGSRGPQITTRYKPDLSAADFTIDKAVVAPKYSDGKANDGKLCGTIQRALQAAMYTHLNDEAVVPATTANFITEASSDEAYVRDLKLAFIKIVRGRPMEIADETRLAIKQRWTDNNGPATTGHTADEIFDTGLDMRPAPEIAALGGWKNVTRNAPETMHYTGWHIFGRAKRLRKEPDGNAPIIEDTYDVTVLADVFDKTDNRMDWYFVENPNTHNKGYVLTRNLK